MSKAAKILKLYAHGIYTTREIADIVGCLPEYVRVVARQRRGGKSKADRKHHPAYQARVREAYALGCAATAKAAYQRVKAEGLKAGLTPYKATLKAIAVHNNIRVKDGRRRMRELEAMP